MKTILSLSLVCAASLHAATQITWERKQLHGDFYSEGAAIGDINGDGKPDVVAGPFWWEGPSFEKKHAFYTPKIFDINGYSDNFFAYVCDFNGDQKNDILVLGFPGKEARLHLNPGVHDDKPWPMSIVADVVDNESPVFTDITGDGKPEIVCSTGGKFGWFAPNWDKPTEKWPFVAVSEDMKVAKFTHGLGVGDVNGDGKLDLLEARRWWEQPVWKSMPGGAKEEKGFAVYQNWTQHNFAAGVGGGAQMYAYDFDGNGTNDVFTALAAHRYGVAVYLQNKPAPNQPTWKQVMLASENPADNDYGIVFSQPHAAALADINGDGVKDIVVGKRYWAHNGHDPDERGARVVYWYETKRDGKGGVDFIPHLVDAVSSVGVDVTVGDVNGDGLPDIVSANKSGVFILTQHKVAESLRDSKGGASGDGKAAAGAGDTSHGVTGLLSPVKMYGPGLKPQAEYAHGQSPQDALKNLQLPTGFKADLIAAEPDIVQPIAFCFDERGRIWVLEGLSYPQPRKEGEGKDRIVILEDSNGDGTFETKKVFCEGISLGSGIEVGFGGVWVGAAPYLMFIPDRDHDDRPDPVEGEMANQVPGLHFPAKILLDGWGTQDTHETLNSFIWGPDGWLYGCHGVFTHSKIGKPGTPEDQRTPMNAGVWRYHPVRHVFEVFAQGTSNPWGLDYDQNGEWFVTACVIPHLYHIVPGARYHRQGGQHFNPYTYEDIVTIADHAHYAGDIRNNAHWGGRDGGSLVQDDTNAAGGGHAHCGLAIYQSSQFPADYRNKLIFGNLHGHRLVTDYLDPHGSTYVGKHGSDFMRSNDLNFIPVTQKVGPDGSLYVSDWSDKQVCHRGSGAVELWDRSNGRIYRVSYVGREGGERGADTTVRNERPTANAEPADARAGKSARAPFPAAPFDLAKESDETLAKLAVQTENEWFSRQARRILTERVVSKESILKFVHDKVNEPADTDSLPDSSDLKIRRQQHELWLWHAVGDLAATRLTVSYHSLPAFRPNEGPEQSRVASIRSYDSPTHRLAVDQVTRDRIDSSSPDEMMPYLDMARDDRSPIVRRELASLLQRVSHKQAAPIARALLSHGEDKDDPYIPLLIWYGIEPLVGADPKAGLELAKVSKLPKVTEFIYRRMGAEEAGRAGLIVIAAETKDPAQRDALLNTVLQAGLSGNKITMPTNWTELRRRLLQDDQGEQRSDTGETARMRMINELGGLMGDAEALKNLRGKLLVDKAAARGNNLKVLVQIRDKATAPLLQQMLGMGLTTSANREAIQALAVIQDDKTPEVLVKGFEKFNNEERGDAVNTLATTAAGAKALLTAVNAKKIPGTMLSPFLARQMDALGNAEVSALIKSAFGDLNKPKADLEVRKKKFRALLTKGDLTAADKAKGRTLFTATCGQCHKLFGEGQSVGPDLTGSNRANLDYLLDNVLDPNAVIGKDYQLNIFTMTDGRVLSGVVKEDTRAAVKIAMMGGIQFTLPTGDIKKREVSKLSTMPEGLFDALSTDQLRQLVAYLQTNASPAKPTAGGPARKVEGAIEAETIKVLSKTGGTTKTQGMGGFGNKWSGGSQLWWTGAKPGSTLSLAIPVEKAGKFAVKTVLTKARDYGICDIAFDGKIVLADFDGYNFPAVVLTDELDLGTHDLTTGEHKLTFTIKGANPQAVKSHMVGVDYVKLEAK